jgi:beta-fructofuranosidase
MSDALGKNGAVVGDVVHVMKASMDDDRHDYYALGRYDAAANAWTPLDAEKDVGTGLRYDWGKFYASKTFYDPAKRRRVLWGWVGETDSERADVSKGWASLQVHVLLLIICFCSFLVHFWPGLGSTHVLQSADT